MEDNDVLDLQIEQLESSIECLSEEREEKLSRIEELRNSNQQLRESIRDLRNLFESPVFLALCFMTSQTLPNCKKKEDSQRKRKVETNEEESFVKTKRNCIESVSGCGNRLTKL